MKRVFPYIRVSSAEQLNGDGPHRQVDKINAWCAANGYPVDPPWIDAEKGKNELKDRPQMKAMQAEIDALSDWQRRDTIVVVENPSRLARSLVVSETILAKFQTLGVQVISADGNLDITAGNSDDPMAKLVRMILGCIAEFEKDTIVNRMKVARRRVRESGRKCEGRPAFGELRQNPKRPPSQAERVIAAREWNHVKEMFALRLAGASNYRIAHEFNRLNVLGKNQMAHGWTSNVVKLIMDRLERTKKAPIPPHEMVAAARVRLLEIGEARKDAPVAINVVDHDDGSRTVTYPNQEDAIAALAQEMRMA